MDGVLPELLANKQKMAIVTKYGEKLEVESKNGNWPIAVILPEEKDSPVKYCYPIFDGYAHRNLYGRLMTIIEAVIEDKDRQKAVKDIVSKEIGSFAKDLDHSALEIANGGGSSENIYTR